MSSAPAYTLRRTPFGRLEFIDEAGVCHDNVTPVRAFPIASPSEGISIVDAYGHELLWIDRLDDLTPDLHKIVSEALSMREFMPIILRIRAVSTYATPSTWSVDTEQGATDFVLKGEEDIRRLTSPALLISDAHGIHYLIRDRFALDTESRRILDRFL